MPPLTHSRRQLIPANAPSTPQISLPSRNGHTALRFCDFLAQKYHISETDSPFALRRLPTVELCSPRGEVPWLDLSQAMTSTLSVLSVWGFRTHAMRFMGFLNANFEFAHEYLYPSPGARDTVSFGLDDILLTAASDSEDFGPALADALLPSGQEARPSAAYSELVDMLKFRAPLRSSRWIGPTSPASLRLRNSMSGSLAAQIPGLNGGSCRFSVICIRRSPDPGNRRFPPA